MSKTLPESATALEMGDRHLTMQDLADREGVALQTVKSWRVQGYGPKAMKINNKFVRFRLSDVIAWEETLMEDSAA
ncbi:helix-turn-helix transcriptional regulator [Rothia halotolerans]|uniref:helix-turn-helix transcriptional regulator n=1 Tax=Rothia halotolerans TaxID=405770 RepID=UPI00192D3641|nr:DNA-binding protein [Rothia halotolerans]